MNSLMNYMSPIDLSDPLSKPIDSYNKISNFLYLGNIDSLNDQDKFYLIVNCTKHIPTAKRCKENIRIPVNDHPTECENMTRFIHETSVLDKIHHCRINQQPVLVHCHAGMQRSAAVIACYLIRFYKMTPDDAIRFIKSKRSIAFYPEANFMKTIQHEYQMNI
jgi:protein tyrosine/serine phosphatase